jgi:hypothetical protein
VDNITHAFVGAAMAECALPANQSTRARAMFMSVGVLAANAPDRVCGSSRRPGERQADSSAVVSR